MRISKTSWAALIAAMALAGPALAGSMTVVDDPYQAAARAEIRQKIPANTGGWSYYCHTGGSFSLWISAPRDGSAPTLYINTLLHSLRSPAEVTVELLGGLPLTEAARDAANFNCYNGCHNDFQVAYVLSPEAVAAMNGGTLPARISVRGEPKCDVEVAISAADVNQLIAWAQSRH